MAIALNEIRIFIVNSISKLPFDIKNPIYGSLYCQPEEMPGREDLSSFWANSNMLSAFGHEVVSADFDDNGISDFAISAPLWSSIGQSSVSPNVGKVEMIYSANIVERFGQLSVVRLANDCNDHSTLFGKNVYKQFGYGMVSGDLDLDGVDDLVISAPFGNENDLSGSVFVHFGIKNLGLNPDPDQEIKRSPANHVRDLFGFSLAMSQNFLTIGAPKFGEVKVYPLAQSVAVTVINATLSRESRRLVLQGESQIDMLICAEFKTHQNLETFIVKFGMASDVMAITNRKFDEYIFHSSKFLAKVSRSFFM